MAITFRQLRYFQMLSQELHFGRAAEKLHISQPPLSASMRQLEQTLGFDLMKRTNRSVRLTPAGVIFADHAARILGQLNAAQAIAGQTAKGRAGEIIVGFVPSMLFRRLPAALKSFQECFPAVELSLQEMNTARQIDALMNHQIDVGFVHAVPLPDAVQSHVIGTERLVCCLPQHHRFAGRGRIALKELAGEQVVVFAREFAAQYHDRIVGLLRSAEIEPHTRHRIQHWFTVIALVAQGMGVSILPRSLSKGAFGDVVYVDIEDPQAEHRVAMIWRGDAGTDTVSAFLSHFRNNITLQM